jgi:hypothetical protein
MEISEDEALRIAMHLKSMIVIDNTRLKKEYIRTEFKEEALKLKNDLNIFKIKVFSPSGEVIYSTDSKDIGVINKKSYFREIVARGNSYSTIVKKDTRSLEGQLLSIDVVETYVPIMLHGSFAGAFEIYYDISSRKEMLDDQIVHSYIFIFAIVISLLIAVILSSFKATKAINEQNSAEEELIKYRENLEDLVAERTVELSKALEEVKTLSGFLPICASCKKIRDDKGYWTQVEEYIRDHSDVEFSHSICPDCRERFYTNKNRNSEDI